MQPPQQQGRPFPFIRSSLALLICCFLVSSLLTEIIQQIHSLRARGVISSQAVSAPGEEESIFCKSDGILWGILVGDFLVIKAILSERVGIAMASLSILEAICRDLNYQPGDI